MVCWYTFLCCLFLVCGVCLWVPVVSTYTHQNCYEPVCLRYVHSITWLTYRWSCQCTISPAKPVPDFPLASLECRSESWRTVCSSLRTFSCAAEQLIMPVGKRWRKQSTCITATHICSKTQILMYVVRINEAWMWHFCLKPSDTELLKRVGVNFSIIPKFSGCRKVLSHIYGDA